MNMFIELVQDMARLWGKYSSMYLNGIASTLALALIATLFGCLIGFACGILNTIPYTPRTPHLNDGFCVCSAC
jgi:putative lysine transport system permease protein